MWEATSTFFEKVNKDVGVPRVLTWQYKGSSSQPTSSSCIKLFDDGSVPKCTRFDVSDEEKACEWYKNLTRTVRSVEDEYDDPEQFELKRHSPDMSRTKDAFDELRALFNSHHHYCANQFSRINDGMLGLGTRLSSLEADVQVIKDIVLKEDKEDDVNDEFEEGEKGRKSEDVVMGEGEKGMEDGREEVEKGSEPEDVVTGEGEMEGGKGREEEVFMGDGEMEGEKGMDEGEKESEPEVSMGDGEMEGEKGREEDVFMGEGQMEVGENGREEGEKGIEPEDVVTGEGEMEEEKGREEEVLVGDGEMEGEKGMDEGEKESEPEVSMGDGEMEGEKEREEEVSMGDGEMEGEKGREEDVFMGQPIEAQPITSLRLDDTPIRTARRTKKASRFLTSPYTDPCALTSDDKVEKLDYIPPEKVEEFNKWLQKTSPKEWIVTPGPSIMKVQLNWWRELMNARKFVENSHVNAWFWLLRDFYWFDREDWTAVDPDFIGNLGQPNMIVGWETPEGSVALKYFMKRIQGDSDELFRPWKDVRRVLIPMCIKEHWLLGVLELDEMHMYVYDSLYASTRVWPAEDSIKDSLELVRKLLQLSGFNKNCLRKPISNSRIHNIPQQKQTSVDCGAFVCEYARFLFEHCVSNHKKKQPWWFNGEDGPKFRRRIALELHFGELLDNESCPS
ncbi:hypothetical protein M5689_004416 [Euphorbia peplus]|nr:hypothetical protein M5689_004416 [Euphorbia peplus]